MTSLKIILELLKRHNLVFYNFHFFLFPGEPLPSVEWYMDNEPIDQTFQQTYEGVVKNDLTIRHLKREHTLSRLRCLAKNNNLTKPVETSVTLKMLCKYPCYCCTVVSKISKKCKFGKDWTELSYMPSSARQFSAKKMRNIIWEHALTKARRWWRFSQILFISYFFGKILSS